MCPLIALHFLFFIIFLTKDTNGICDEKRAKFLRTEGIRLENHAGQRFTDASLSSCLDDCRRNPNCRSVAHNGHRCASSISDSKLPVPAPNYIYFQKVCLETESVAKACADVFPRFPRHALIGHARTVKDAKSLEDCLNQCIYARGNEEFHCRSFLFYDDRRANCILNSENRQREPTLFAEELDDAVDYVDVDCDFVPGRGRRFQVLKSPRASKTLDSKICDRYLKADNHWFPDSSSLTLLLSFEGCSKRCTLFPECKSFNFFRRRCTTFNESGEGRLKPKEGYGHFRKVCLDRKLVEDRSCPRTFLRVPNRLLDDGAEHFVQAANIEDCVQACIDSGSQAFVCQSGMYFKDGSCVLNSKNRRSVREQHFKEMEAVDYFEVSCTRKKIRDRRLVDFYRPPNRRDQEKPEIPKTSQRLDSVSLDFSHFGIG